MENRNPYGNKWDSTDYRNWEVVQVQRHGVFLPLVRLPGTTALIGFSGGAFYRRVGNSLHQYPTGIHALDRSIRHGLAHYRSEVDQLDQVWQLVGDENIVQIDLVTLNAFDLWAVNSRLNFGRALQVLREIQGDHSRQRSGKNKQDHLQKAIGRVEHSLRSAGARQ